MLQLKLCGLFLAALFAGVGWGDSLLAADAGTALQVKTGVTRSGVRWIKPERVPVTAIEFWPDGSKFAVATGPTSGLQVFDAKTHALLRTTDDEVIGIASMVISPDGKSIVVESGRNILLLLDGETCRQTKKLSLSADSHLVVLAFSHDGRQIAAALAAPPGAECFTGVQLYSAAGELIREIPIPDASITSLSFSKDDKCLAIAMRGSEEIHIFSTETGEKLTALDGHTAACEVARFSPDGKYLASGARPGSTIGAEGFDHLDTLRLWDVRTGKVEKTLLGHIGKVVDLAFSSDSRFLATVGEDQALFLWEVPTGKRYGPLCAHAHWINTVKFSPDDRTIVTGGRDAIFIWDVQQLVKRPEAFTVTGDEIDSWPVHWPALSGFDLSLSQDGKTLVTFMPGYGLSVWDFATRNLRRQVPPQEVAAFHCLSPDARQLIFDDADNHVVAHEISVGKPIWSIDRFVCDLQFTRDGKLLLGREPQLLEKPHTMFGLSAADGRKAFSWAADEQQLTEAAISPNGKWIATAGAENKIKIWRLSNRELVKTLDDWPLDGPLCISPNGKRLAAFSTKKKFCVWDVESGKRLLDIDKPDYLGFPIVFLRDQTTIASSGGNWITLWDTTTGQQTEVLKGHPVYDEVRTLLLAPDGQTLLSAGRYGTIKFWKVP